MTGYRKKKVLIINGERKAIVGTILISRDGRSTSGNQARMIDRYKPSGWEGFDDKIRNEYQFPDCSWSFILLNDDIEEEF
jgi:hypothetical protein